MQFGRMDHDERHDGQHGRDDVGNGLDVARFPLGSNTRGSGIAVLQGLPGMM